MGNPSKMRASLKDGVVEVKALMQHAMENGRRKDEAGNLVPAWYITDVKFQHGDRTVLEIQLGTPVSKNPLMGFRFKGGKVGEKVTLSWVDNRGDTRSDVVAIG
jgi:sulfur-oxidizing protein SoxZ